MRKIIYTMFIAIMVMSMLIVAAPAAASGGAALPGGTLDPTSIPKYVTPLVIPPAMPLSKEITVKGGIKIDYYEIAVRQFDQYILPESMGKMTTVWSYGSVDYPQTFNYPAFTIEAQYGKAVRVKWINELVDAEGNYLPHLLPVDQTLHWANPGGGEAGRDMRGNESQPYEGPVPMITHVHGAHTTEDSDGYPEAWYLPNANDIPTGYATVGTKYDEFMNKAIAGKDWEPGAAVFQYPNDQRATTLWYHDHTLGMTRLNVYAGPAGFYIIRGGPDDKVYDSQGRKAKLPRPAPATGDAPGMNYYEIPIVIQDRSFNEDGTLFYPDNRAFFEGLEQEQLQIPFIPDDTIAGNASDVSPIWNPEFFGNTMVVNGKTWPYLEVEQRQYRFRLLNGAQSRFLILKLSNNETFWQIGAEGGFLPAPVELDELLIAPAERADVIVDFANTPVGTEIILQNLGPDEPFGGGIPGIDFDPADADTTGQVMQFRVINRIGPDNSTPASELVLPTIQDLGVPTNTQYLSLNEEESATVWVKEDGSGNVTEVSADTPGAELFGPTSALLGTTSSNGTVINPLLWMDDITENPALGATEIWELRNFTMDAHPIHIHLVQFQVVERVDADGNIRPPELWETGFKDTVIAYPGEITRVKARFDIAGLFVWHCHILEHEDNEMMRPYRVGP